MKNKRPNIVFFFTDQQRWDSCGCYGQALPVTPNLDAMAREGVLFQNAFTCQPVCGPVRSCIQTGKYATEMGTYRNGIALPEDEKTIAHWFSEYGYETAYIGKWHLASNRNEVDDFRRSAVPMHRRGGWKDYWLASDVLEFTSHGYDGHMFDRFGNKREFPEGRYRVDAMTDWIIEYLNTRERAKPFFLFASYIEPHQQNDRNVFEGPIGSKERFADFTVPGDLVGTEGDWRDNYPDYLGSCNALDAALGRVRSELDRLGLADDTIIVYTSDHGCHFRTRNKEYKRSCHDSSLRVPMVAYGPGFPSGVRCDSPVSLIDAAPTFLDLAGIPIPPSMRGVPLRATASGSVPPRDAVYAEISENHAGRALRTNRWTYEVGFMPENASGDADKAGEMPGSSDVYYEYFLYDNEADPHQRNNLIKDPAYAELREQFAARILEEIEKVEGRRPTIRAAR